MTENPHELFELFYKNITSSMHPWWFGKYNNEGIQYFWRERFMNAFYGNTEPRDLQSWAEAPIMWLAGYRELIKREEQSEPKPKFVPPPPCIKVSDI